MVRWNLWGAAMSEGHIDAKTPGRKRRRGAVITGGVMLVLVVFLAICPVHSFALRVSVACDSVTWTRVLTALGARPNWCEGASGESLLSVALQHGNYEIFKLLLDAGADTEAPAFEREGCTGLTPLQKAAFSGDVAAAKLLIDAGADLNAPEETTTLTPLHLAALFGHAHVAKLLLDAGADKDAMEFDGDTPLFLAVWKGDAAVVKVLLDAGASPEKGANGLTPLHYAAMHNQAEIVRLLLEAGADTRRTAFGGTAAERTTSREIRALIENWAAPTQTAP